MSYTDKINEHKKILKKCQDSAAFNIGAGRAYYCAFISIKNYLISKKFDYSTFLTEIKRSNEREYSHGTIKHALCKCLLDNKNTIRDISKLFVIDNLYKKRRIADYTEKNISNAEFLASCEEMKIILDILETAK